MNIKVFVLLVFLAGLVLAGGRGVKVPYFDEELGENQKLQEEVRDIYDGSYKEVPATAKAIVEWTCANFKTHPEAVKSFFKWLDKNPEAKEAEYMHSFSTVKLEVLALEDEKLKAEVKMLAEKFKEHKGNLLEQKGALKDVFDNSKSFPLLKKFLEDYAALHKKSFIGKCAEEINKK
ncbi:MAG: hypothetical protein V1752_04845 [Candidatus Firestonebacteria bacterium]